MKDLDDTYIARRRYEVVDDEIKGVTMLDATAELIQLDERRDAVTTSNLPKWAHQPQANGRL